MAQRQQKAAWRTFGTPAESQESSVCQHLQPLLVRVRNSLMLIPFGSNFPFIQFYNFPTFHLLKTSSADKTEFVAGFAVSATIHTMGDLRLNRFLASLWRWRRRLLDGAYARSTITCISVEAYASRGFFPYSAPAVCFRLHAALIPKDLPTVPCFRLTSWLPTGRANIWKRLFCNHCNGSHLAAASSSQWSAESAVS